MSFWTAIVIIVAIGTISEIYRSRLKANSVKAEESYQKLSQRIVSLEERMANLETIVLEKEKSRKFSEL